MSLYRSLVRGIAKAVAVVAPGLARRYLLDHAALSRGYDAGKMTGFDSGWRPVLRTGNREIGTDWRQVVDRGRDLVRNNAFAANALRTKDALVCGDAIWPQARIRKPGSEDGELDRVLCDMAETAFAEWARDCTVDGRDWDEVKSLCFRHLETDGEVVVVESQTPTNPYALQLFEADQIDSSVDGVRDGKRCVRGIEYDGFGRPVAYYLLSTHPGDWTPSTVAKRVSADRVIHLFVPERISEGRGICRFAASVMPAYSHEQHRMGVLDLLRVAAGYGIMIKTEEPAEDYTIANATEDSETTSVAGDKVTDSDGNPLEFINPAGFHYLPKNTSVEQVRPEQPTASFREFERSHLFLEAAGFGMSYEFFTGDLSGANFSSLKAGLSSQTAQCKMLTAFLIRRLAQRVHPTWMDRWVLAGKLALPGYWARRADYQRATWSRPAIPTIDQEKEEAADTAAMKNGSTTLREIIERKGGDFDETIEQRALERRRMAALGLNPDAFMIPSTASPAATGGTAPTPSATADSEPATAAPAPADAGAADAGVTTALTLNGAQIESAVNVILQLASGAITAVSATNLLTAVGLKLEDAQAMVAAEVSKPKPPAAPVVQTTEDPTNA